MQGRREFDATYLCTLSGTVPTDSQVMTDTSSTIPDNPLQTALWCAIPVYNNAGTIRDVATRCRKELEHVVVVDDGSTDADLGELLRGLDVTVLRHPHNLGKGAAILTALQYVAKRGATYLLTIDGDAQHFPEDIPRFFSRLDPGTVLIGAREEVVGTMPRSSRFGRDFSDFWILVETGVSVRDTQSGFRVYPVKPLLEMSFCSRHYNFEMEVVTRAIWAGLRVAKVPIRVWYPPQTHARVSSFRPFRDNLRISLLHSRLVGRRLLPIPHKRLAGGPLPARPSLKHPLQLLRGLLVENTSPLGLAAAAWVGIFLGTLPLLFCHVAAILYVSVRLHLNKVMAVAIQTLCVPPVVPILCIAVGYRLQHGKVIDVSKPAELLEHPLDLLYEWFLGSLIVAPLLATVAAAAVYLAALWLQSRTAKEEPQSTHTLTATAAGEADEHR